MNLDGCDRLFSLQLFRTLPVGKIHRVPSGLCSLSIFFLLFYSTSSAYPLLEKSYVEYVRKISKKKSELTQPRTDHDDLHCDASLVPSVRSDLANVAMYDYLLCNKAILAIFYRQLHKNSTFSTYKTCDCCAQYLTDFRPTLTPCDQ